MTPEDYEKLQEIQRLLDEAYDHYFKYESHAKSYEGRISITFNNYWDRKESGPGVKIDYINIASYVFCHEGRSQDFDSLDDALETVREWHKDEMAYDYEAPEEVAAREEFDKFAVDWLNQMQEDGRLFIHMIDGEGNELR